VVEARLKGSGMHWAPGHVDPMLALRTIEGADGWDAAWPSIARRLRHEAQTRRAAHLHAHQPPPAPPVDPPTPAASPPTASARRPRYPVQIHRAPRQHPPMVVDGRPTAQHPWRQPSRPHDGSVTATDEAR